MPVKELILVRHGQALSEAEDPERPLTPNGRWQVERTASILSKVIRQVDVIYHSSKKRAEETALILANSVSTPGGVRWRAGLDPNDPVEKTLAELDAEDHERVLIAGHLPFLPRLASHLLCGRSTPPLVGFGVGSAAGLSRNEEAWVLRWMIDPSLGQP